MGYNKLYGRKGEVTFSRADINATQQEGGRGIEVKLEGAKIIILHPSLCTPTVHPTEISPESPLSIFILTDIGFYNVFLNDPERRRQEAGPRIKELINYFLKIEPWEAILDHNKDLRQGVEPLFADNVTANCNIECTYLGHLGAGGWKIWDKNQHLFAGIRASARDHYLQKEIIHGFQVDIIGGLSLDKGLYNASWVIYDPNRESLERDFLEVQDRETTAFLQQTGRFVYPYTLVKGQKDLDFSSFDERPIQSHHPIYLSDEPQLNLGHLTDVHVSSRQHAFQKSGAQMLQNVAETTSPKLGQQVNASFHTLKDLMDQFGNEHSIDMLVFTGDLIDYTRNYDPAARSISKTGEIWEEMLVDHYKDPQKYPVGIDNLIIYSLFMYWYDVYQKPILLVSGNHEAYTLPYGISPRVKRMKAAVDNAKNIFIDKSVNQLIDESVEERTKEWADRKETEGKTNTTRADEGIPADHNLTISEAILLYGPDYNRVTMTGSGKGAYKNFKPINLDWFYTVFTPFSDFVLNYKNQCFIGLGWGDDEKFTGPGHDGHVESPFYGGHLPRAPESISVWQKSLVKKALKRKPSCAVLLSHFTLANYGSKKPLEETGEINCNDLLGQWSDADHGTFEQNRSELYQHINDDLIQLTLSGHSHRSGLYQPESFKESLGRKTMTVRARAPQPPQKDDSVRPYQGVNPAKAKLIVSASGGPIPKQNYAGELFNWGLERPSGTLVQFNGIDAQFSLIESKIAQAKPRFAVAWDYADIFGTEKHGNGVFTRFDSGADGMSFTIEINPALRLPEVNIIDGIELYHYTGTAPEKLLMKVSYVGKYLYKSVFDKVEGFDDPDALKDYLEDKLVNTEDPLFLCLRFNKNLSNQPGFKQYDFASPWNLQVELIKKAQVIRQEFERVIEIASVYGQGDSPTYSTAYLYKEMERQMKQARGDVIRRHPKHGEVPDFEWRVINFNGEFAFSAPEQTA